MRFSAPAVRPEASPKVMINQLRVQIDTGRKAKAVQLACHELLRAQGYAVAMCFGAEAALDTLLGYLNSNMQP